MKKLLNTFCVAIIASVTASTICFAKESATPKILSDEPKIIGIDEIATKFEAQITASTQDSKMEWWFNLPANSAPHVIENDTVLYYQNFSIFAFFENASIKDGKYDITYSVTSTNPKGKKTLISENIRQKGEKKSQSVIVASTNAIKACFYKDSPEGEYNFEIEAKDEVSGVTSKNTITVKLKEWTPPPPIFGKREVDNAILGFYKNPAPEILYALFYSPDLNLEQKGAPNDLNYIYLGFFRAAFLRNSFLATYLRREFPNMTPLNRAKTIYLFAITDEARIDFDILTEAEKKYQDAMRKSDIPAPYADWNPVLGAVQIDMLWGEFFADGTYKPIRRIMDLLSYTEEGNFAITSLTQKRKPTTRQEWKKMMMGMYHNAAMRSLLNNAERFELVRKYCLWALQNNDIPQSAHKLLDDIVEKQ